MDWMTCVWRKEKRKAEQDAERLSCAWRKGGFLEVIKVKGEIEAAIEEVVDLGNVVKREDGSDDDEAMIPAFYALDPDDSEPVPDTVRAGVMAYQSGTSPSGDVCTRSKESVGAVKRLRYGETAKLKVFGKENGQKTAEVVQEQCTDEIVDAPVVVQCGVKNGFDEVSDLKRRRGERLVSGKDSRHRSVCRGFGVDVVGRIQVAGDQEPGVEVGQKSSLGPDGDPRSPKAKQIWVRWGARSRAVDLNEHTKEEIKRWMGMKTEKGLYLICNGRKVRWDDLEEMQEGRVVEVKAEMSGGMGNKKKARKGKNQSEEGNSWTTAEETEQSESERVGSGNSLTGETTMVNVREAFGTTGGEAEGRRRNAGSDD